MQIRRKEYEELISNVILDTIKVEQQMDAIIAEYFCSDKQKADEFSNMILFHERITFEFKKDIICNILNNNYKHFLKEHPTFLSLINKIPEHRNRFAHLINLNNVERDEMIASKGKIWSGLNPEVELKNPTIELIIFKRYKNGKPKYIGYARFDFWAIQKNSLDVSSILFRFAMLIKGHPFPPFEQII